MGGLIADGVRRPPTAKGTAFIRLEREEGIMDVIIPEPVFVECREALDSAFVVVEGRVQAHGVTVTLVARRIENLKRAQDCTDTLSPIALDQIQHLAQQFTILI